MSGMLLWELFCYGPVSLLNVKLSSGSYLVDGKNVSSFTNDEEDNYAKADVPFELETALVSRGGEIPHKAGPWAACRYRGRKSRHRAESASAKELRKK